MSESVSRITAEYVDLEDRIRLIAGTPDAPSKVIWLTQRLLNRLVPVIVQTLDQQVGDGRMVDVMQSFAQQAAEAELVPEVPVALSPQSDAFLAHAVDLAQSEAGLSLTFRSAGEHSVRVTLPFKQLRQWLGIVHGLYLTAGWPVGVWPDWVQLGMPANASHAMVLH